MLEFQRPRYASVCLMTLVITVASNGEGAEIVVANRGSGNISVVDTVSHMVTNFDLPTPSGGSTPEPMYVVYMPDNNRVYVGDRANDRVVIFDPSDYSISGEVGVGAGVFHMWGDPDENQLWVVGDIDDTVSVIDTSTNSLLTSFPIPGDITSAGGRPHDVILDPNGPTGYVSIVGLNATQGNDSVLKFEHQGGTTFTEVARAPTGGDPHVSLTEHNDLLYVPAQDADHVRILNRGDLSFVADIPVDNAHGVNISADANQLYVTNISGGGTDGLFTIDAVTNSVSDTADTPAVPHNIALSPSNSELYITHSGMTSNTLSIYSLADPTQPTFVESVTVGVNPFGLAAVSVPEPTTLWLTMLPMFALAALRWHRQPAGRC